MKKVLLFMTAAVLVFTSCKKDFDSKAVNQDLNLNAGTNAILDTVTLPTIISANKTLSADTLYLLKGKVFVTGGTLTIPAGTRIEGVYTSTADSSSALVITKTGKISAKGTQANPIIFTSHLAGLPGGRTNRLPGDWGGIVILGDAPTNKPTTQFIEGINPATVPVGVDVTYGGSNPDHNGGVIQFSRIEFAGAAIAANNELNSLTCGGVGKKTGLRYIMASYGADDAFEFFGGLVAPKYLIANSQNDDAFDFDFGYVGDLQFGVSVRNSAYAYNDANGIECDNDATGSAAVPKTRPSLSNLTIVGKCDAALAGTLNGARFRRATDLRMRNSIIIGYNTGIEFSSTSPANAALFFRNNGVHAFTDTAKFVGTSVGPWGLANFGVTGALPASWLNIACPATHSSYKSSALAYKAGGQFDPAVPTSTKPNFSGLTTNFLNVPYIGAVGPGSPLRDPVTNQITVPNNWVAGSAGVWTNFDPS